MNIESSKKAKELAELHMQKCNNNLLSARIERLVLKDEELRKNIIIKDYTLWDWVIIKSYYAMYHAVLALLAKLGIKTKTHFITLVAFEFFFIKKKIINKKYLAMFNRVKQSAKIPDQYLDEIRNVRSKRFTANYDVESSIQEKEANDCMELAEDFIKEMKRIFNTFQAD